MLHHWDEQLKLLTVRHAIAEGWPTEAYTAAEVWADKKSVTAKEYYQATQAGIRADVIFLVHAYEYGGQTLVECRGIQYDVVRIYQTDPDTIALTCARRGERT